MVARSAADQVNIVCVLHPLDDVIHFLRVIQQVKQFPGNNRLLVDLLEHEVGVTALLSSLHRLDDFFHPPLDDGAIRHTAQFDLVGSQDDDLAVLDAHNAARERQEGGQVRGDYGAILRIPGYQPRAFLESIQHVLILLANDERIITFKVIIGLANGVKHLISLVNVTLNGMHTGLAVVLRTDNHPFCHELLAQFNIVDHVPIMRPDQVAVRVQVGL